MRLFSRIFEFACKEGKNIFQRNWKTTREAVDDYLKTQSVFISLPKNIFGHLNAKASLASVLTPEEPEKGEPVEHAEHSKIFEEFERLNPQISFSAGKETKQQVPTVTQPAENVQSSVLNKLDTLSESLGRFAERVTRKLEQPKEEPLTPEQKEFFEVGFN